MKKNNLIVFINPFLVSIYHLLFIININKDSFHLKDLSIPLLFAISISGLIFLLINLFFKHPAKSAIFTTVFLCFFFHFKDLYVFLHHLIGSHSNENFHFAKKTIYSLLILIFPAILFLFLNKLKFSLTKLNNGLFAIFVGLTVFNFSSVYLYYSNEPFKRYLFKSSIDIDSKPSKIKPNIYYIILDAHANQEVLKHYYKYDNSLFNNNLRNKGFKLNSKALSNYPYTIYSLSSSLNLNYINSIIKEKGANYNVFYPILKDNLVRTCFEKLGYESYFTNSGFFPLGHLQVANKIFYPLNFLNRLLAKSFLLHEFIDNTPFVYLLREHIRSHITCAFSNLKKSVQYKAPFYYLAHILCPHGPYIFKPDGSHQQHNVKPSQGYIDNLKFIDNQIIEVIDYIITHSKTKPIIIIQGDHGWTRIPKWGDFQKKDDFKYGQYGILNAMFLPNGGEKIFYPGITPVNTFRSIFNYYFGTKFPLLPNKQYMIEKDNTIKDVTKIVKSYQGNPNKLLKLNL